MDKKSLFELINQNEKTLKEMAATIWENAEGPFKEKKASKLQQDFLEKHGFKIIKVPDMETAFIAEIGHGKPIIGILGEYDALPGMSQKVSDVKEAYNDCGFGHGCGHNLLGTSGVGAVIALKEIMEKENIQGTLRYYGCPAEETLAGKVIMA